jgi:RND family efflux transporter MFP subunit
MRLTPGRSLLLFLLSVCAVTAVAQTVAPPAPVIPAPVREVADDVRLELVGSGLARRAATLQTAAAGEVRSVQFRAGERVRAGQLLLALDDRAQTLAVAQAETRLDAARRLRDRLAPLDGSGALPQTEIDDAVLAFREAELALAQAREALKDRRLLAPFDGVVGLSQLQPGDRAEAGSTVTTIDDRRALRVRFAVPEQWLARLQKGQTVAVATPAHGGQRFEGRLVQIDSRVDPVARTVPLEAEVPNADDRLRPGMSFTVHLALAGTPRPAVPELAVQWDREGAHVWAVRDGKALRVGVRPLRRQAGVVLVDGPLRAGEAVVVEGVQRLRPGRAVEVVGQNGAPA